MEYDTFPLGRMESSDMTIYECNCKPCRERPTREWSLRDEGERGGEHMVDEFAESDDRLLICPPRVLGYVLSQKIWGQFCVKDIQPLQNEASDLFEEELELESDKKLLLKVGSASNTLFHRQPDLTFFLLGIH